MSNTKPNRNQRRPARGDSSGGRGNKNAGGGSANSGGSGNGRNATNGGGGGNGGGNPSQADKGRANNRRRKGPRKKKVDPRVFWGDPEQLAALGSEKATITANPSAVIHSLGRPPLSGQQNAAEHYFIAVYDRAVNLAAALAAAGNLIEAEDLNGDVNR